MHESEFSTSFQMSCKLASGRHFRALAVLPLIGRLSEIVGLKLCRAAFLLHHTQFGSRSLQAQCHVNNELRSHKA